MEALHWQKDDVNPGSVATWTMVVSAAQAINAGVLFLPVPATPPIWSPVAIVVTAQQLPAAAETMHGSDSNVD